MSGLGRRCRGARTLTAVALVGLFGALPAQAASGDPAAPTTAEPTPTVEVTPAAPTASPDPTPTPTESTPSPSPTATTPSPAAPATVKAAAPVPPAAAAVASVLVVAFSSSSVVDVAGGARVANRVDPGDTVRVQWKVTNTGAADASDLVVTAGGPTTCTVSTLAPGASTWCTTQRALTRAEVDAGSVTLTARATATVDGLAQSAGPVSGTRALRAKPALDVKQTWRLQLDANKDGKVGVGDKVGFVFTLTNTGNVTLLKPAIASRLFSLRGMAVTCRPTTLYTQMERPGQSVTCWSASYDVRQANYLFGKIVDRATVSATIRTAGTRYAATSSLTISPIGAKPAAPPQPKPAIALVTRIASIADNYDANGVVDVGDDIYYEYVVRNIGEVTLGSVSISDRLMDRLSASVACPSSQLAVGASMVCRGSKPYTVTRTDFHNGSIRTASVASGTSVTTGKVVHSRAVLERALAQPIASTLGASGPLAHTGAGDLAGLVGLGLGSILLGAAVYRQPRRTLA